MKTMITGVQPTGNFTLGNYMGAIKNFVALQDKYESYLFIADLHGLTSYQEPQKIRQTILDLTAIYLACGVDLEKTNIFVQSSINEHSALGFLVAFQCRVGELSRMTQYKAKKQTTGDGVDLGLFIYPTLMAADILLYDAEVVPVGADQKQHIEITRDLGERFNKRYGDIFQLPNYYTPPLGQRIMNLQNPLEKMSKSAPEDDKGTIFMLDDVEVTKKKIMSAKTDSANIIKFDEENKPGISNLLTILAILREVDTKTLEIELKDLNYGQFKKIVADELALFIIDFQSKYQQFRDEKKLQLILDQGTAVAQKRAADKLKLVKEKFGIDFS